MNLHSVLSYIGVILEILGILALLPMVVCFIFGEPYYIQFLITGVVSFALGSVLDKSFEKDELDLGSAMVVAAIGFTVVSLLGAIPYFFFLDPLDSLFESVSGFTTTGLTVMQPEGYPLSLLFWRSFTQWIGGIGIVVIFLLLIASPGISSYHLYRAEGKTERIEAGVKHSVKKMFKLYAFYTVLGVILLYIAGMPLFDSVLNSFTSISTGGFTPKNGSIGAYGNPWIELVIIFLMIVGGTSFFVHSRILRGSPKNALKTIRERMTEYFQNPETRIFWCITAIFSVLLTMFFLPQMDAVRHGIFHTVSAITTTGYTTLSSLPSGTSMFLLIILMIVGGYAGSTAGGLKLVRVGVIGKAFVWLARKISLPFEAVIPFRFGSRILKETELSIISLFVSVYLMLLLISSIIFILLGYPPMSSFFEVASAQGTVGLTVMDLTVLHWLGKIVLMINMLLGRLEIFPFLVLIYGIYRASFGREKY